MFDLYWFLLHKTKESYWATPPEKRHLFLSGLTEEENKLSLDDQIARSLELQRAENAAAQPTESPNGTVLMSG